MTNCLYIFSGLPACGKTTLAQRLAAKLGAAYLRIDTIEQALRDVCGLDVQGEGYRLAYRVAADNLRLGCGVVADSCNPIALTRREWEQVAGHCGVPFRNIEVTCSDVDEHRYRVETRRSNVAGLELPDWQQVLEREYQPWQGERIRVDTAHRSPESAFASLCRLLEIA